MEQAYRFYEETLGYAPGQRISTPEAIVRAMERIAERWPARTSLEVTGHSHEGRPLQLLTIASETNIARLDTIRKASVALVDTGAAEPVPDIPVTVWIISNVHGDEHSAADAALLLAFHLAGTDDPALRNAVVGIDPLQNPDGRARSVSSHYSLFGLFPRTDPWAAEHHEAWGAGRGNHYFFDMNRDWFPLTQPESQARVAAFLRWRPQVLADVHEMWSDSRYFFPPPARPVNPHLSEHVARWWSVFGGAIAEEFDTHGWDYWSGETFDAFYPGYGEAFPSMHGCVAMTLEQASAGGLAAERKDGTVIRYEEAIRHHFAATLRICREASERSKSLLRDARAFFISAPKACANGPAAYVFPNAGPGTPAEHLAALLTKQGIRVNRLASEATLRLARYDGSETTEQAISAGAVVVCLDQPEGRAARAILERETPIEPGWLAEQIRRRAEFVDAEFYDHTAWSLPLALGAEAWTSDALPSPLEAWEPATAPDAGVAGYGWLLKAESLSATDFVCRVLERGVRVHVAWRDFSQNGTAYPRGTFIVKRADQPEGWEDVVHEAAAAAGVALSPAASARTDGGIALGSDNVTRIAPPKVAVLYGEPGRTLSYGWMAWLFEQRIRLPFTPVRAATLKEADLRRYDALILPDGDADDYARLPEDIWKRLHEWTRQGGTLIAIGGAAACLCGKGKDWTTCKVLKDLRTPPEGDKDTLIPREFRPEKVTGAALRVTLDRHNPATLGFGEESHVPFASDLLLTPSVEGRNVAVFAPEERLVLAGFVWERMRPALPGKAYAVDESQGRGHVVLFADDPNQRGYWEVSARLFTNAVLLRMR